MKPSISELIAERIDGMPAGERRSAQTLIANYPLTGLKTVADFAQQAGVSSPTILRFVARLGFQSYPDFQATLQEELAAQLQSPATRGVGRSSVAGEPAPLLAATIDNINETFRHLSDRQVAEIDLADTCAAALRHIEYSAGGKLLDRAAHRFPADMHDRHQFAFTRQLVAGPQHVRRDQDDDLLGDEIARGPAVDARRARARRQSSAFVSRLRAAPPDTPAGNPERARRR